VRTPTRRSSAVVATAVVLSGLVSGASGGGFSVAAAEPDDMVTDWNVIALATIGGAQLTTAPVAGQTPAAGLGQPPPLAPIHLAMVHGAVYDAVIAIVGGYEPYLYDPSSTPAGASKAAAAATAARDVLAAIIEQSPFPAADAANIRANARIRLDALYASSLAEVPDGQAKLDGIAVGQNAAAAMLADRARDGGDGRFGTPATFEEGQLPGQWRALSTLPTANVFNWVARVRPFTMNSQDQFRTEGPLALSSRQYAAEFNEVKALGAKTGSTRNVEQNRLASFVSANPVPIMNGALRTLGANLSVTDQARLFVQSSMASADALIGCWDDKDHWNFWRPQTAIQNAANDGNAATVADPTWESVLTNPGYPDHPSGYNCFTASIMTSARLFFGTDRASFTLASPGSTVNGLPGAVTRNYTRFSAVIDDAIDGRIYTGFHFRTPDVQGAWLGKKAAQWVDKNFFEPTN
jgi:hypothetical protein